MDIMNLSKRVNSLDEISRERLARWIANAVLLDKRLLFEVYLKANTATKTGFNLFLEKELTKTAERRAGSGDQKENTPPN